MLSKLKSKNMKYWKTNFKVVQHSPKAFIRDGELVTRMPDVDGENYGFGEELPSEQSIHNLTSEEIHSVVITELTKEEYIAAGHTVK